MIRNTRLKVFGGVLLSIVLLFVVVCGISLFSVRNTFRSRIRKKGLEVQTTSKEFSKSGFSVSDTSFSCQSTCVCLDDRRSIALSKSIFYVVSATSMTAAVYVANRHFSDSCQRHFSTACAKIFPQDTQCEVKEVDEAWEYGEGEVKYIDEGMTEAQKKDKEDAKLPFDCSGRCLSMEDAMHAVSKGKDPKTTEMWLKLLGNVKKKDELDCKSFVTQEMVEADKLVNARHLFATRNLANFCGEIGKADGGENDLLKTSCFPDIQSVQCEEIR